MGRAAEPDVFFTIILPVFNDTCFFRSCIDSVINQSFCNFEIIIVDDGSFDSSGEIAEEYAKKYEFIKVCHQHNGGLSSARNLGIRNATGKYLLFVDSDDFYVSDNALSILFGYVTADKPQALFFLPKEFDSTGTKIVLAKNSCPVCTDHLFQSSGIVDELYRDDGQWITMAQTKVIERDYLLTNNLFFVEGIYHEDDEWIARILLSNPSIKCVNEMLYGYRHRGDSIIRTDDKAKQIKKYENRLQVAQAMLNNDNAKKYPAFCGYACDYFLQAFLNIEKAEGGVVYIQNLMTLYKNAFRNFNLSKKPIHILISCFYQIFGVSICIRLINIIYGVQF